MKTPLLMGAATALVLSSFSAAAESSSALSSVTVTTTRSEIALEDALPSVTLISREDIERLQPNDIADLLRFIPGVDVARSGGAGQQVSAFIRGGNSDHTLYLIDGVRFTTETFLNALIQHLTPESIERIEVVKGSRSAAWGSDAIGGVVNIITRTATEGVGAGVTLKGGSYGTRDSAMRASVRRGPHSLSANIQRQEIDGFPPLRSGGRRAGHENTTAVLSGSTGWRGHRFEVQQQWANGTTEYLRFGSDRSQDFDSDVGQLSGTFRLPSDWALRVSGQQALDLIEQLEPDDITRPDLFSSTEVERRSLEVEAYGTVAGVDLRIGGLTSLSEIDAQTFSSFGDSSTVESTRRKAVFGQASAQWGALDGMAALRYTDHKQFGDVTTGSIELGYRLREGTRVAALYGTGFKEPDLTDLFGNFGNPDLEPEQSKSSELSLRQVMGAHQVVTVALFDLRIRDFILFDPVTFVPYNATARIQGTELSWQYDDGQWRVALSGSLQDPKNEQTGGKLVRRSHKSLSATVQHRFDTVTVGVDVFGQGRREDSNQATLGGYGLLNADIRWRLNPELQLALRGENLLDKTYELVDGYRTPGSSGYLTLRYDWQP